MTITLDRPAGCLEPVAIDRVVPDPERIRDLARANGPYFMPARYLIDADAADSARSSGTKRTVEVPPELIGPVWRGDWCTGGSEVIADTADLLHLPAFVDAAKSMCAAEVVVPEQVYVNLTTPMRGNGFSHTDIPEFIGMDRTNTPGWLLLAMGASRLFEEARITIVTAVAWFHHGERGYFRYWPHGRDAQSVRHENMWNTAVVGDNDFMHHKVERSGPADLGAPDGMTIDTTLDHDGTNWLVMEDGTALATYDDEHVRLSLSWKAKVYANNQRLADAEAGVGAVTVTDVLERFAGVLDEPLAASGDNALASDALRAQLSSRYSGYRAD
jgi:hypothetical protein